MHAQALEIASWGANVFVKIPITNTKGESAVELVRALSGSGVQVNVTAMFTRAHVQDVTDALDPGTAAVVSVFAGRIADTGIDPVPLMREFKQIVSALDFSFVPVLDAFVLKPSRCFTMTPRRQVLTFP